LTLEIMKFPNQDHKNVRNLDKMEASWQCHLLERCLLHKDSDHLVCQQEICLT
jgi:hypothetical protein